MGTITLRPSAQYQFRLRAISKLTEQGIDFDTLPEQEQYSLVDKEIAGDLQRMLKRIRASHGSPLRFIIVGERHKSGLPHYHCIAHEYDDANPLRHKQLASQWPHGFTTWKLVDPDKPPVYVGKYLSKDNSARVRASIRYGNGLSQSELANVYFPDHAQDKPDPPARPIETDMGPVQEIS